MLKNFNFFLSIIFFFIINISINGNRRVQSKKKFGGNVVNKNLNKLMKNIKNNNKRSKSIYSGKSSNNSKLSKSSNSKSKSIESSNSEEEFSLKEDDDLDFSFDDIEEKDSILDPIEKMILFINDINNNNQEAKAEAMNQLFNKERIRNLIEKTNNLKSKFIENNNNLNLLKIKIDQYSTSIAHLKKNIIFNFLDLEINIDNFSEIKTLLSNKSNKTKKNLQSKNMKSKKINNIRNKIFNVENNINNSKEINIEEISNYVYEKFIKFMIENKKYNKEAIEKNKIKIFSMIQNHIKNIQNIIKYTDLEKENKNIDRKLNKYFKSIIELSRINKDFSEFVQNNSNNIFTQNFLNKLKNETSMEFPRQN